LEEINLVDEYLECPEKEDQSSRFEKDALILFQHITREMT